MAAVEHFTPESLDEVAALLLAADGQARPLTRGGALVAEVREEGGTGSVVIDLGRVPELNRLDYDERIGLRVGAAVPLEGFLAFPPVLRLYAILADGTDAMGPAGRRNDATFGEGLDASAPAAGIVLPLICLRASAGVYGPHGWSELAVEALFSGAGGGTLQRGEFVVDVHLPAPIPRSSGAYAQAVPAAGPPHGLTGVGAFLVMEDDLVTCCGVRLGLWAASQMPLRALEAERFLGGKRVEEAVLREAGALVAHAAHPTGAAGRPDAAGVPQVGDLTRRAILLAQERIRASAAA